VSRTSTAGVRAAQAGVTLTEYLEGAAGSAPALDGGQRQQVVDAMLAAVAGVYAHLPLKRAGYALDPVQALVLLRRRWPNVLRVFARLRTRLLSVGIRA